jgi:hypothetical protein
MNRPKRPDPQVYAKLRPAASEALPKLVHDGVLPDPKVVFMQKLARMTILGLLSGLLLGLAGCAAMMRTPPVPGDTLETVRAKFGEPSAIHALPSGQVLEYATGPFGQFTWMARMGPDGRLLAFEQVLGELGFGRIKIDQASKAEVALTLGRPAERSYLALSDLEVWSYRYKESGVWNSMMHVHFDRNGIVRKMISGPDPMYEEKRGFFRD